jgi:hypothetical protein
MSMQPGTTIPVKNKQKINNYTFILCMSTIDYTVLLSMDLGRHCECLADVNGTHCAHGTTRAMCRHVHLLKFASTSANPSSLLRRFSCGTTYYLSIVLQSHYSIKSFLM